MGVLDQLEGLEPDDDAPADPEETTTRDGVADPFSMDYDFEEWELDADTTDHALSIMIAVTNLL